MRSASCSSSRTRGTRSDRRRPAARPDGARRPSPGRARTLTAGSRTTPPHGSPRDCRLGRRPRDAPHRRYNPLARRMGPRLRRPHPPAVARRARSRRRAAAPAYDPTCYLCPGNRGPTATSTRTTPRRSSSRTTSPRSGRTVHARSRRRRAAAGGGRARAPAASSCFSPRHDLTLGRMSPARRPARHRRLGRPDRRARRATTVGPGLREPRRGDGRLEPASPRPDLGRHGAPAARPPARTGRSRPSSRAPRPAAAARLRGRRNRAARGSWSRTTTGWSVVPFWAVWPFETLVIAERPRRAPARPGRPAPGLARRRPDPSCCGAYDGLFKRPSRTRWAGTRRRSATVTIDALAAPRPLLPAAPARPTSASSWSATSCSPRPSAT